MNVFRLTRTKYARDLSGTGARIAGGRWNNKGIPVLYTSSSRSLALSEFLVHLPQIFSPEEFSMTRLQLPEGIAIAEIAPEELPDTWKKFSFSAITRQMGDRWMRQAEYPVLKVPSAIVDEEFNYLVNPLHKEAEGITITDIREFDLDKRLLRN